MTAGAQTKKELITSAIGDVRKFRFCGPSDDPDEQTAVTLGFRHLVIQLKRLAAPLLPAAHKLAAFTHGATVARVLVDLLRVHRLVSRATRRAAVMRLPAPR
jgi:hypothetical protein